MGKVPTNTNSVDRNKDTGAITIKYSMTTKETKDKNMDALHDWHAYVHMGLAPAFKVHNARASKECLTEGTYKNFIKTFVFSNSATLEKNNMFEGLWDGYRAAANAIGNNWVAQRWNKFQGKKK